MEFSIVNSLIASEIDVDLYETSGFFQNFMIYYNYMHSMDDVSRAWKGFIE